MTLITDKLQMTGQETKWASSKGNQNKWFADGMWYKEDGLGYEALAEILVSRLLAKTNVETFVSYEYEQVERNGRQYHGCRSADFLLPDDDKLISVERLFQAYKREGAAQKAAQFETAAERIRYIAESIEEITGLNNFGDYLRKVLTVDALFLNEDRHFHNIAVIQKKDGTFRECPLFDHGASLFSDTKSDYPLEMCLEECFQKIQAKPFSRCFDEQLDACEILYGGFRFHAFFTMKDVELLLEEFRGLYEERILIRVLETMGQQMRKYAYLF
ncbi:hypothetical protein IMSAGC007_02541 [Lachnospiraceae bacterium]|nr:hypothetical protein IMSAGC007_02541 [Lachnospiraceae bacterium]